MKNPRFKSIRAILLMMLVNCLIGNSIATIIDYTYWYNISIVIEGSIYSIIIGTTLWKGNEFIYVKVSNKFPWLKQPLKTLTFGLLYTSIFSCIVMFLFNYIWIVCYKGKDFTVFWTQGYYSIIGTFVVIVFISLIIHSIVFFYNWKTTTINAEKLKRESLALQYEALRNQLSPHFLFNSLNVLTSLVYKDPNLAEDFIRQLEEVYRYVLNQKDKEMLPLTEEIEFVNHYIFLQKIRFDKNLVCNIHVPQDSKGKIIPLSLQLLVENAIKHNIISEESPLIIDISLTDNYLTVTNNLQRKKVIRESSKIGLDNIKARYEFLTQKKFIIEETNTDFIVKLPLLN